MLRHGLYTVPSYKCLPIGNDGPGGGVERLLCSHFVPGVSAAMIIFPEVFISLMGLDKVGAVEDFVYKFYRGVGWLFLGGMFLLM